MCRATPASAVGLAVAGLFERAANETCRSAGLAIYIGLIFQPNRSDTGMARQKPLLSRITDDTPERGTAFFVGSWYVYVKNGKGLLALETSVIFLSTAGGISLSTTFGRKVARTSRWCPGGKEIVC